VDWLKVKALNSSPNTTKKKKKKEKKRKKGNRKEDQHGWDSGKRLSVPFES
jgi:hypothetical protein